jgi:hypothetical protein
MNVAKFVLVATAVITNSATALAQRAVEDDLPPPPPRVVERTVVVESEVEASIAGQVLRTKQVDIRGTDTKVLVALLDTGNDRRQIVDLGPTANFRTSPVYTGDQIAVRGHRVMLGNANVLLATEVRVSGDLVTIFREGTSRAAGYFVMEPIVRIDGRIENLKNARLRGSRSDHLVGEIVNRNGGAMIVDFGPPTAIWRADLKAGDWITIQGQQMQVNERPVILASEINKNGAPLRIERELIRDELAPVATVTERVVAP